MDDMTPPSNRAAHILERQERDEAVSSPSVHADDAGRRLRVLRKRHGLSQRDLARRAGIANGAISMIEQGQVSPSVASLRKLAGAMSLSLADFFTADIEKVVQPFVQAKELLEIGGGGVSLRMVPAGVAHPNLQVMREVYAPGSDTGPELLSHPGEEAGVVVRGHITVVVGGQQAELGPGDGYYFDSRLPHRFVNTRNEECEIISSATPPSF